MRPSPCARACVCILPLRCRHASAPDYSCCIDPPYRRRPARRSSCRMVHRPLRRWEKYSRALTPLSRRRCTCGQPWRCAHVNGRRRGARAAQPVRSRTSLSSKNVILPTNSSIVASDVTITLLPCSKAASPTVKCVGSTLTGYFCTVAHGRSTAEHARTATAAYTSTHRPRRSAARCAASPPGSHACPAAQCRCPVPAAARTGLALRGRGHGRERRWSSQHARQCMRTVGLLAPRNWHLAIRLCLAAQLPGVHPPCRCAGIRCI